MKASNMGNDMEVLIFSPQEQIKFADNTCMVCEVKTHAYIYQFPGVKP